MVPWLALAGIGVATDNLRLGTIAGIPVGSRGGEQWLGTAVLALMIQLQGFILGWLLGRIMNGWFGNAAHWVAIGFLLCTGIRMLFETTPRGQQPGKLHLTTQTFLDATLGTAIYTFVYGQSAIMLHATLSRSFEVVGTATALCILGGMYLARRSHAVRIVRLWGGVAVCVSAIFLFAREL